MPSTQPTILRIDSSARKTDSVTRGLADEVMARLQAANPQAEVRTRDLLDGVPLLNEVSTSALGLPSEAQSPEQLAALATSDALIEEFLAADFLVIGAPIYNFSIPAALKAYIDLVTRAGRTFHYTDTGPAGLVADRPTYIVSASGGVEFGSDYDFATGYLRHILGFLGITDVTLIGADALMMDEAAAMARAETQLVSALG